MLRWLWPVIVAMALLLFILGIDSFAQAVSGLLDLNRAGAVFTVYLADSRQAIQKLAMAPTTYVLWQATMMSIVFGLFLAVAGLIYWKRQADSFALLAAYFLLLMGMTAAQIMIGFGFYRFSQSGAAILVEVINSIGWNLFVAFALVFPDGRFVPRWTRWLLLVWIVVWFLEPSTRLNSALGNILEAVVGVGCVAIAALAQIYRYRRVSTPLQRQQTKWVALGLILFISLSIVMYPFIEGGLGIWFQSIVTLLLVILPLSIGVAILRAGLWDVDLIIRKTLLYGVLTFLLALLYFGAVLIIQSIFTAVSGQESAVAIVISTLMIAALFNPLRNRTQAFIDRRFYRRKYDAVRTLERFAQTARDEVDLERLAAELVRVVEETVQPESAGLWLQQIGNGAEVQEPAAHSSLMKQPKFERRQ